MTVVLLIAAAILAMLIFAWWLQRRHRDVEEYDGFEQPEYREPPIFLGRGGTGVGGPG